MRIDAALSNDELNNFGDDQFQFADGVKERLTVLVEPQSHTFVSRACPLGLQD